jgi:DNA-binding MarR family transcriptional regulator
MNEETAVDTGAGTHRATDTPGDTGTGTRADAGTDAGASARTAASTTPTDPASTAAAERIWRNLRVLVLERNERRKETSEALGMSFFRVKVLRRVTAAPARLSEIAAELGSDRPYLTLVVDDLEKRGLVERRPHPTDRRCKIVSATPEGRDTAARAEAILGTPPPALLNLPPADLTALDRITADLTASDESAAGALWDAEALKG